MFTLGKKFAQCLQTINIREKMPDVHIMQLNFAWCEYECLNNNLT